MLPSDVLSTRPVVSSLLLPDGRQGGMLHDFEMGGVALNDGSQGIELQLWVCWVDRSDNVRVRALGGTGAGTILFNQPGIIRLSFSFDSNMQPAVAYEIDEEVRFYWFDSVSSGYVTTTYAGARTPRVTHDDKRDFEAVKSDVLLVYLRDDGLYQRKQRDRYLIEYTLETGLPRTLRLANLGMGTNYRVHFEMR